MDSHHIVGDGLSTPLVMERLDRLYPVSYTHLDVYKRQARTCM